MVTMVDQDQDNFDEFELKWSEEDLKTGTLRSKPLIPCHSHHSTNGVGLFNTLLIVYDEAEDVIIIVICDCLRESTHLDRHGVVEERLWESLKKRGHPVLQVVHIDQVLTKMKTERPQIQNANQRRLFIVDKSPRHNLLENCIKVHFLVWSW